MFYTDSAQQRRNFSSLGRHRWIVEPLEKRRLLSAVVALTSLNELWTFDTSNPSQVQSARAVTGLSSGESLLGIDIRPANGLLYGLGSTAKLYTLNPESGAASLVAALAAEPSDATAPFTALAGTDLGVDFDPISGALRVVSNAGQNLRIDSDTGRVITDAPLAYDDADTHAGAISDVVDLAYTNNAVGAAATESFGIDSTFHELVRLGGAAGNPSANLGRLFSVASVAATTPEGLDIASDGTVLAGFQVTSASGPASSYVASLDLATGAFTTLGTIGSGAAAIRDIASVPSVQFGASTYAVAEAAGTATITLTRTHPAPGMLSVNFSTSNGSAIAGDDYLSASRILTFASGQLSQSISVPIVNDSLVEGDEKVRLVLTNPSIGVIGGPSTAVLRIDANDSTDASGPTVLNVGLTGPSRAINGAVVTFSEAMDPTTVQSLSNYTFTRKSRRSETVELSSAVYDPVARTVTLTAATPFQQTNFKEIELRVNGKAGGPTDTAGNLLDGDFKKGPGGTSITRFRVLSGETVTIKEHDGDRATLTLAGGGRLDALQPIKAAPTQESQLWIVSPLAGAVLTGSVRPHSGSNGTFDLAEAVGLQQTIATSLANLTTLRIGSLIFDSNATGKAGFFDEGGF